MKRIAIGLTGASGSILAIKTIRALLDLGHEVYLVTSEQGKLVAAYELGKPFNEILEDLACDRLRFFDNSDLFAPVASGSFPMDGMIIVPCSMGTLAKLACGISDSLLTRAGDVMLKERRPLVLVARETPLSSIHLENMLKLSKTGAVILPPVPAFYHKPETLDEVINQMVGRVLATLNIKAPQTLEWEGAK